ncbi:DUF2987 domain-containing protein [Caulobacter sp. RL271]|uniref:DUF2987 domain-containing protein n=1 Tax=Caulobacter segnis TaxID=88688 RepID=A0ABY4ZNX3_9CAUL|nr:DUF2987 domain-containing protein [Caulobacter segnis]USQ94365.1 DUF2987 domain-containing protein [Caulobacter segnis]
MRRSLPLILAGAVLAATAGPAFAEKSAQATKVLPFLDKFLKVPPAERSRLKLAYAVRHDGQMLPNLKAALVERGGARTPLPVDGEGYFERLPTLAQLEGDPAIVFDVPEGWKMGTMMTFGTQLKPAQDYDARELAATVAEANTVIGKAAGVAAFMAPKMTGVVFPKAESGVVVFANGRSAPLPKAQEFPYFRPADHQGAVRVKLTRSPTKVAFYDGKK